MFLLTRSSNLLVVLSAYEKLLDTLPQPVAYDSSIFWKKVTGMGIFLLL